MITRIDEDARNADWLIAVQLLKERTVPGYVSDQTLARRQGATTAFTPAPIGPAVAKRRVRLVVEKKYNPDQPRDPKGTETGGQWTAAGGGTAHPSHIDPETGMVDTEAIVRLVNKAVAERPSRAEHGNTGDNAFWIVGDKIYQYNKYNDIPESERRYAISVHSHSASLYDERIITQGKRELTADERASLDQINMQAFSEPFEPLNSADIYIWLKAFREGRGGPVETLIMADGRMQILQLTTDTEMAIFKKGQKTLDKEIELTYAQRSEYYDAHHLEPDYDSSRASRESVREWCRKYGIRNIEDVRWRDHDPRDPRYKEARMTPSAGEPPRLEHWPWPALGPDDDPEAGFDTLAARLAALGPAKPAPPAFTPALIGPASPAKKTIRVRLP